MKTLYLNADVLLNEKIEKLNFYVSDGKFYHVTNGQNTCAAEPSACGTVDLSGCTVLPALFDIHTHGANGFDFNTADADGMGKILTHYYENGVGSALATVMTDSRENTLRRLSLIAEFAKNHPVIKGVHLEGPFLSQAYKGAMDARYLLPPDIGLFEKYQKAAGGLIKLITIAPELESAAEFTKYVAKNGGAVSLGHSAATYAQTLVCLDAGANSFTHTFNAMKPVDHHSPSIALAALLSDAYAEAVCDGHHLAPEIVRLLLKTKTKNRLVCVTDSTMAAGLADGEFSLSGAPVTVKNGEVFLTGTGTRAGSALSAFDGLNNYMNFTGEKISDAILPFTLTPASLLGLQEKTGSLAEGKSADFFAVKNGKVAATFIGGENVYRAV